MKYVFSFFAFLSIVPAQAKDESVKTLLGSFPATSIVRTVAIDKYPNAFSELLSLAKFDDALIDAIARNDLTTVETLTTTMSADDLNKDLIIEIDFKEFEPKTEMGIALNYLVIAIRCSKNFTTSQSREASRAIVRTLIQKGADTEKMHGEVTWQDGLDYPWSGPAAFEALRLDDEGQMLRTLLEEGADPCGRAPTYGSLLTEAEGNNEAIVREFMAKKRIESCGKSNSVLEYVHSLEKEKEKRRKKE